VPVEQPDDVAAGRGFLQLRGGLFRGGASAAAR